MPGAASAMVLRVCCMLAMRPLTDAAVKGLMASMQQTLNTMAEAAPGILRSDAEAVNAKTDRPLYAARVPVYPKRASGMFRRVKWGVMAVTLGIYYVLPWLRW